MASLLPIGADPLTVDLNYIASTTETDGTLKTVAAGKVGVVLGISLVQVASNTNVRSRASILINGQESGMAIEADSSSPDLTSNAGDSHRYSRETFYYVTGQIPILNPGDTINVRIKNSTTSNLITAHARVYAYEYTP